MGLVAVSIATHVLVSTKVLAALRTITAEAPTLTAELGASQDLVPAVPFHHLHFLRHPHLGPRRQCLVPAPAPLHGPQQPHKRPPLMGLAVYKARPTLPVQAQGSATAALQLVIAVLLQRTVEQDASRSLVAATQLHRRFHYPHPGPRRHRLAPAPVPLYSPQQPHKLPPLMDLVVYKARLTLPVQAQGSATAALQLVIAVLLQRTVGRDASRSLVAATQFHHRFRHPLPHPPRLPRPVPRRL
jgi:preprotein translocase subunit SecG